MYSTQALAECKGFSRHQFCAPDAHLDIALVPLSTISHLLSHPESSFPLEFTFALSVQPQLSPHDYMVCEATTNLASAIVREPRVCCIHQQPARGSYTLFMVFAPLFLALVRVLVTDQSSIQRSCHACWQHRVQTPIAAPEI